MGRGRIARTTEQLVAHLAENSALTDAGCLEWTGPVMNRGYGRLSWSPDPELPGIHGPHRIAFYLLVRPIPHGGYAVVVDHLCGNRLCILPDHLQAVSQRENSVREGHTLASINAAKTHCAKGHPYDEANTYTYVSKSPRQCTARICKTCRSEYSRRYYLRKKAS